MLKKISEKKHNIFYVNDNKEQPITSGGVIIYRFTQKGMELLLVNSRGGYEDLGGKIDKNDKTIHYTVSREAEEESNFLLNAKKIKKRLTDDKSVYSKRSKYVVYLIEARTSETKLKSSDFGDMEIHDNVERTISWIPLTTFLKPEIIKYKLNWRIKNALVFKKLIEIQNNKKLDVNMFSESSES